MAGQRVLDAGCGGGSHAAEMIRRGASVTGLDKSAGLLAIARQRLDDAVPLHQADLGEPLPFPSASFDAVLASLVMHYLQDWGPTLAEFRRVLMPGGRLVISTHHPFMDHPLAGGPDYFATYDFTEEWTKGGQSMLMRFWHRPLHAMTPTCAPIPGSSSSGSSPRSPHAWTGGALSSPPCSSPAARRATPPGDD